MNYENKAKDYYSNVRLDLISLLQESKNGLKVMEIGSGYGETLNYLRQEGIASEVVGVDIFEDKENKSRYKDIDRFIFGNIENLDFPEYKNYFDLILLPDVVEHLIEPNKTFQKVRDCLKQEGHILVSMPNIRHYSAFVRIFLKGNFKYESSGIFDYTHYRFYCKKNIEELILDNNFKIIYTYGSINFYRKRSFSKVINKLTFGIFEQFLSPQYFVYAKK